MSDPFFARFPLRAADWRAVIGAAALAPARQQILASLGDAPCLPPPEQVFAACELTPLAQVRVLIIGQDPYPTPGDAHGLAFSVAHGRPPRSLVNVFTEIQRDCGGERRRNANLSDWAAQGVLLLNRVLTTAPGAAGSHRRCGWEAITSAMVSVIADPHRTTPLIICCWGKDAAACAKLIPDSPHHRVLISGHPSPLAYHRRGPDSFQGCGHFAAINAFLSEHHQAPIAWV
ncbi:MAG: uracil-DNA glycosylase [Planctomycetota bacterium]|nr:MAG: uracil-DNA glycosylase [Planctomycetota bacterium]